MEKASALPAAQVVMEDNHFEQVRFAFALSPTANAGCGLYDLTRNTYRFTEDGSILTQLKLQNADSSGDRFRFGPDSAEYLPADGQSQVITQLAVSLGEEHVSLYHNGAPNTAQLTATVTTLSPNKTVTWFSSNEKVASVDQSGLVTAVGQGEAIITAAAGPAFASCTVTVGAYVPPAGSSGSASGSGDKTESTTHPDGSVTVTVTRPDGTVTQITTDPQGNREQTVTKPDGSAQTVVTRPDGASSTTNVSGSGRVDTQVKLPAVVVDGAAGQGQTVALPMPSLPLTSDQAAAPTVSVALPSGSSAKVEIPVANVTPGTVAVIVKADGTEEILKHSLTTRQGVSVTLADGDTVKIVDNSKTFSDVDRGYWGSDYIDFATSREIFQGTSATTFTPEQPMTRAMIVTVLAAYDGADTSVSGGSWYESGRQWAMDKGISDGTNLDKALTREQLAVMLWNYAGSPAPSLDISTYADGHTTSGWARSAMAWAVEQGLISGMGDGSLAPQGEATRAQVAAILYQFVSRVG